MKYQKLILSLSTALFATSITANTSLTNHVSQPITLQKQPGFFRFSFENVKMPEGIQNMGLLGINYFADITPLVYGGISGYGSVTGTQGGLFVLGVAGGIHKEFRPHWWADAGVFVGGGGGRSSMVGGGFMWRPQIGLAYSWSWARLGLHYSYIDFVSGKIRSSQLGLDLDLPCDFYYVSPKDFNTSLFNYDVFHLSDGKYLDFQRNDFGLILQAYRQKAGTQNVNGDVQDGTIGLVGAELDHYMTQRVFWYVKMAGAYHGIPNGYMDVLGGLGYHWAFAPYGIALVPQMGVGAGGGGEVDAGGGLLVQPQLGLEVPLSSSFAARVSGGYIWAPKGQFQAATVTGEILYHLDVATGSEQPTQYVTDQYKIQGWRFQVLNQRYVHPQRATRWTESSADLIAVQVDQLFTPWFFFSYQAAAAYRGDHTGGYATGMIGPGVQTPEFFHQRMQLFGEVLVGAGGGGNFALGGGALIEPVAGIHYALTPAIGLQASVGQLKAIQNDLNTPVINLGLTLRFGTLNQIT